jgi:hypothetical protein
MKRDFDIKGIHFEVGNFTPRHNPYERGLKYRLFVDDIPTSHVFSTIKEAKNFAGSNYFIWL